MDPKLLEMLDRLSELTPQELGQLEKSLVAEFNRMDKEGKNGHTPESVDLMEEVAEAAGRVRTEIQTKADAAAESTARADKLREQMNPQTTEEVAPEVVAEADPAAPAATGIADETVADVDPEVTAVAATGAPKIGDVTAPDAPKANTKPVRASARGYWRSSGAVRGPESPERGAEFESVEQMALATVEAIDSLGRGSGDPVLVASLIKTYPPERTLSRDPLENYAKMEAVTGRSALLATGGICAPVAVDYNIMVVAVDDEPLAAGLPDFNASRGGLRYLQTPTFAGVGSTGTGVWTAATDASPGGATKPVQVIACGTEQVTLVDAIPTRLRFGNMMERFSPEVVAANTQLAMANAARVREVNRLTKIAAASTAVSTGQLLGAARDFLATLDQACAAVRFRHRLSDVAPLQAILPRWVKDMLRADFVREIGHSENMFAITDAQLESFLSARNVSAIWTLDGQASGTQNGIAYPLQGFGSQSVGLLLDWPKTLVWYLYPTGTFQRLDGGRLDVGVVRDSVLDSTNDYEVFVETFEGIAFRGFESLELISALRPNGGSAGTINTTTY